MPLSSLLEVKNEQEQQEILDAAYKETMNRKELSPLKKVFESSHIDAQEAFKLFYDLAFIDGVLWSKKRLDLIERIHEQN